MVRTFDVASLRIRLLPECSIPQAGKPGAPEAAVAIIIDPSCEGGSVLFIRRTEREGDPWSGQIAFPGGHERAKDRDFRETAVREAEEEVGIDLREQELLGVLPPTYSRTRRMFVAPFIFRLKSHVNVRLNEEAAESFWMPLSDLATIRVSKAEVYTQERHFTEAADRRNPQPDLRTVKGLQHQPGQLHKDREPGTYSVHPGTLQKSVRERIHLQSGR